MGSWLRGFRRYELHATYAKHPSAGGGGRKTSLASLRRFCGVAASGNSNCAPRGPRNRRRPSRKMRLRCAKSISTRFLSWRDCSNASVLANVSGYVASLLVDTAWDSTQRHVWTTTVLERTLATVNYSCTVQKGLPVVAQLARRLEKLVGQV